MFVGPRNAMLRRQRWRTRLLGEILTRPSILPIFPHLGCLAPYPGPHLPPYASPSCAPPLESFLPGSLAEAHTRRTAQRGSSPA